MRNPRIKYNIYTLGCKVNQYDSGRLGKKLESFGAEKVDRDADLTIINTCAVTKTAITKGRRTVSRAKRENPDSKIVVMGCWTKIYKTDFKKNNFNLIWGTGELEKLMIEIKKMLKNISKPGCSNSLVISNERTRYFIKVQDGCEQFCSYCIIPYTRGKLQSRPEKEIITEVTEAIDKGYKEFVLTGIHLGLYGKENNKNKSNLATLISRLVYIKGLERVRLSSIEIIDVNNELIDLMFANSKICQHLHIPLQSGSDKILKLMNRPYNTEYFEKRIKYIKKRIHNIAISTDVIVGFPGEGEMEFKETYNFIKKIGFSRLHVFPFSAHEKTPAFNFKNQVGDREKIERAKKLRNLGKVLEEKYRKKFKGKKLDVIIERKIGDKYIGKTQYYFDIDFEEKDIVKNEDKDFKSLVGEIVDIKL